MPWFVELVDFENNECENKVRFVEITRIKDGEMWIDVVV